MWPLFEVWYKRWIDGVPLTRQRARRIRVMAPSFASAITIAEERVRIKYRVLDRIYICKIIHVENSRYVAQS